MRLTLGERAQRAKSSTARASTGAAISAAESNASTKARRTGERAQRAEERNTRVCAHRCRHLSRCRTCHRRTVHRLSRRPVSPSNPRSRAAPTAAVRSSQSPKRRAWRRFRRNHLAFGGLIFLVVVVLLSVFAPWIARHDPTAIDLRSILEPPSREHWLGTDQVGRDVFARLLYGGRISLPIGATAALSTVLVGMILGSWRAIAVAPSTGSSCASSRSSCRSRPSC